MRQSLLKSFYHAFVGIMTTIKEERNIKIHIIMSIIVSLCAYIFHISKMEFIICLLLFALVISLELVNSAIEAAIDLETLEINPLAKKAKDAAAGAVLIAAIFSVIIGLMIFLPYILK